MGIIELFSKRRKKERGELSDIYEYDNIPEVLRVQIIHIWGDSLGSDRDYIQYRNVKDTYFKIVNILCREYGLFELPTADKYNRNYLSELANFLLQENDIEKVIDIVELTFRAINRLSINFDYMHKDNAKEIADNAIDELNQRFKEHGIGYQFIDSEIIRIDSELIHKEVVKPALKLLNCKDYKGAEEEFLSAYEHYRHKRNKESLIDCLKAFESTIKAICIKRKWKYQSNATVKNLINICFEKKLIPDFWQNNLNSLRSLLEGAIPTARNKMGGHGQGNEMLKVPDYLVSYMLHMTASTLVFLIEAEKNL